MKSAIFAVALMIGGAAYAQSQPAPAPADDAAATAAAAPAADQTPARDARGVPVVSDPATPPPGFNGPPRPADQPAPQATPQPDTAPSPPCSRTVTDNCVQTYERGRSPQ